MLARTDAVDQTHHLRRGLASGRRIGTAVGMLAARHGVEPAEAFALLRTASQLRNQKVALLAEEVLAAGDLGEP